MVSVSRPQVAVVAALLIAIVSASAQAAVTSRVDRRTIDLNESFLFEVVVDTDINVEPDISALEADFDVLQRSQLSNTMIVNNEITRSRTWTYQLMAKRTGQVEIPPVTVAGESSQPIPIVVREPTQSPPGEADVFITAEVDNVETYVQSQVLYRIKVYRAVPTRQPALRDPVFEGAEVLVETDAIDERSYDSVLNGRTYNVVERVYPIFPQQSGEVSISPARFEARVLRDGRITGRKVFESESQTIRVLPMPDPPAEFPDAAWLPARDLQLTDGWSRDIDELAAGEPITRNVVISVLGQLETQIPVLPPPVVDGVSIYPDRPELSRRVDPGGIRGIRKEQYAIIGTAPGTVRLPAVEIPWWDVSAGEWRVASLPERSIDVIGSGEPPVAEPPPAQTEPVVTEEFQLEQGSAQSDFWQLVAEILAVLWLLTLVAWWWQTRPQRRREPQEKQLAPPPAHKQQSRLLKDARKAAQEGEGQAVRHALLEWARLEWPDAPPRSIGALAQRVSSPLSEELTKLSSAAYGSNGASWDGDAIAQYLRSFAVLDDHAASKSDDPLPPLMPNS